MNLFITQIMSVELPSAPSLSQAVAELHSRVVSDGGLLDRRNGVYRTDATAWAAIVIEALGSRQVYESAARRLAKDQLTDGRIPIVSSHATAWWPTALAVVAWAGVDQFRVEKDRAVQFLLQAQGTNPPKQSGDPVGHDTTLRGWSWVEGTHSWVEPTSITLLALAAAGITDHPRVHEAVRLLLNRQLQHGGWNYGNTTLYGRELHPMPENTGAALAGLAGHVPQGEVESSLEYLQGEVGKLRTPVSLGWSLLGLAAWNRWPSDGGPLVEACLNAQSRYGDYDTTSLCLLLMSAIEGGVLKKSASLGEAPRVQDLSDRIES